MLVDHSECNGEPKVGKGQCHSDSSLVALMDSHNESMKLSKHHEQEMAVVDASLEVEQLNG